LLSTTTSMSLLASSNMPREQSVLSSLNAPASAVL